MTEGEPPGVQRMPAESDRAQRVRAVGIALLADERVAAQSRLDANLITSPGFESNLEQRGIAKSLERRVFTNRVGAPWIARVRFLLDERCRVPYQSISPRAGWRIGISVDHCQVHALRLTPLELRLQPAL